MTSLDLINRLGEIIRRKERHRDYERVNKLKKLYTQLITGEDMDELLQQFTPRESVEMFQQRVRITQHMTKTVSQNVMDIFYKVPRSNSVQRSIAYKDNDVTRLHELNALLLEFWGDQSLDDYMNMRWFELNFIDPNAFVVTEWGDFDANKEHAMPYPFEVDSAMAIQYEYHNNDLIYLVSEQETKKLIWDVRQQKDVEVETEVYTIYGEDQTVQFIELGDEEARKIFREMKVAAGMKRGQFIFGSQYDDNGNITTGYFIPDMNKDDVYLIKVYAPHNLGYVPAKRVGFKRDLYTNGRTFVSPLDKATPILMKMVKANSEMDLTMALHVFPQKVQYAAKCKSLNCRDGHTVDGGDVCPECHGSGFQVIRSAQDIITIALPKSADEIIDLKNLVHYVDMNIETPKFQDAHMDKLTVYVKEAVFNTELFSKKEVSETATGKNISLQNVYDSLYPVAQAYSKNWYFFVTTVADITDLNEGLIAFYHFSKDFKLKSLSDLYFDLKMVGDARASEFVKSAIESDIASIIYSEDERGLKKYNVKQSFYPFSGKSPEQITLLMGGTDISKFTKVFYANFGFIFDMVEQEQAVAGLDFYDMARPRQLSLIEAKVNKIIAEIEKETPEPQLGTIDGNTDPNVESVPTTPVLQ